MYFYGLASFLCLILIWRISLRGLYWTFSEWCPKLMHLPNMSPVFRVQTQGTESSLFAPAASGAISDSHTYPCKNAKNTKPPKAKDENFHDNFTSAGLSQSCLHNQGRLQVQADSAKNLRLDVAQRNYCKIPITLANMIFPFFLRCGDFLGQNTYSS